MDLRVQKTYKALKDSFTELLTEMRYEDITIGALCDRAMIRRTTFYKHFSDKNDFFQFYLEQIQKDFIDGFHELPEGSTMVDSEIEMVDYTMSYLIEHEKIVNSILEGSALDDLVWICTDFLAEKLEEAIEADEEMSAIIGSSSHSLSLFISGGISKLVICWWTDGHTDEGREEIHEMIRLIDRHVKEG